MSKSWNQAETKHATTAEIIEMTDPQALLEEIIEDAYYVEVNNDECTIEHALATAVLRLHRFITMGGRLPANWLPAKKDTPKETK